MRLDVSRPGVTLHGRQVYLPLLVILVSHVLLMVTPLHDVVLLGHRASQETMDVHSVHAAIAECVGPAATGGSTGIDCAIRGNAPPRSAPGLLLGSAPVGRPEPLPLADLLPAPPERSTWPPPLPELHVLFQVFRL
jgi:hypothetical protein